MSKRFGRNQKRRMRQEAESLRAAVEMNLRLMQDQGQRVRDMECHIRDVAGMVGRYAIAAGEAPDFCVSGGAFDGFRMVPYEPMSLLSAQVSAAPIGVVCCETMRLLDIELIRDHMARVLHCHVKLAGKEVGYAISEKAIYSSSIEELSRCLARGIARSLATGLKKVAA